MTFKAEERKCDHVDRVAVHPSVVIGGASVGHCDRPALPLLTRCAWHADPQAVTMAMRDLWKKLRGKNAE